MLSSRKSVAKIVREQSDGRIAYDIIFVKVGVGSLSGGIQLPLPVAVRQVERFLHSVYRFRPHDFQ
jgi:hypothetical protein